jgi:hypothetical protein
VSEPRLHPFTAVYQVDFARPIEAEEHCRLLAELLERIALGCVAAGARLIGHIKAFALQPGGGYLVGSVTSARSPAQLKDGELQVGDYLEVSLTVLVYGLERECLAQIVAETWLALSRQGLLRSARPSRLDPTPKEGS